MILSALRDRNLSLTGDGRVKEKRVRINDPDSFDYRYKSVYELTLQEEQLVPIRYLEFPCWLNSVRL